ncbi:ATP-binding protein [Shimia biformata]|uniref:ATP-binding protein n=1 Tax=Shimia biformata TaxID=1294299 RepID=UPI001EF1BE3A|nr:ATP-binding protein [Shimia biformata]
MPVLLVISLFVLAWASAPSVLGKTLFFAGCVLAFLQLLVLRGSRPSGEQATVDPAQLDHVLTDLAGRGGVTDAAGRVISAPHIGQEAFERLVSANPSHLKRAVAGGLSRTLACSQGSHALPQVTITRLAPDVILWVLDDAAPQGGDALEGVQFPVVRFSRAGDVLHLNAAARKTGAAGLGLSRRQVDSLFDHKFVDLSEDHAAVPLASDARGCSVLLLPRQVACPAPDEVGFDTLPVPLLRLSTDGVIERANGAARRMIGASLRPNMALIDLVEGLGRSVNDWLTEAATGAGGVRAEFLRLKRPEGEVFVQVSLGRVAGRDAPHLVAVLNDATELKTLEAQFVQSQKMQAIGQLAGGVAHDFNNLLTAITGHCDLLLLRHDQGDPDFADLVQINQNANRAAALVGQLLAFSRKQTLQPERIDLRDTLSDLTHLLNRLVGEKVSLVLEHDPVLPSIRADKRQLEQVLMNLIVNARDAMPDGGRITIETRNLDLQDVMERDRATVPPGQYVRVTVRDEGTGISPEVLDKVFEPFYTTKRTGEGTGLGLSTAYGIVKQTGGFIFVDSKVGQGTSFQLIFPVFPEEPAKPVAPAPVARDTSQKRGDGVILLVEDEAPVRSFAARALRLRGYTVIEAESGERALEILDDSDLQIDLFVSDVIMPGLDGPGWVAKARQARPDVPVVFMSGYAEDSFADKQARIANSDFLPKPFSLTDLTAMVQDQFAPASAD